VSRGDEHGCTKCIFYAWDCYGWLCVGCLARSIWHYYTCPKRARAK
jgi:hypothetical protein